MRWRMKRSPRATRFLCIILVIGMFLSGFWAGSSPLSKNGAALHDLVSNIPSSLDYETAMLQQKTKNLLNQTSLVPLLVSELHQTVQNAQTTFFYPHDPVFSQVRAITGQDGYRHLEDFLAGFEGLLYHLSINPPSESNWRSDPRVLLLIEADEVLLGDLPQESGAFHTLIDHLESEEGTQVREQFEEYVL